MDVLKDLPTWPFMIVGALISCFFLVWNSRKNTQKEAARNFRCELQPTIFKLINSSDNTIEILESDFEKHELAVKEYANFLFGRKKVKFEREWRNYAFHPQTGIRFLEAYSTFGVPVTKAEDNRLLAQRKLESLLEYARL